MLRQLYAATKEKNEDDVQYYTAERDRLNTEIAALEKNVETYTQRTHSLIRGTQLTHPQFSPD